MKILFSIPAFLLLILVSCSSHNEEVKVITTEKQVDTTSMYFGDSISVDGAIAADQLAAKLSGKDSIQVKLSGTIDEVCQKKGCWMNMNIGNGEMMRVRFKDYAFFVPKDAAGKSVFIEGYAYTDTTSVAELKHYAEDAGKTKEEISKITKPEVSISFEANGVLIKK